MKFLLLNNMETLWMLVSQNSMFLGRTL